MKFFQPDKINRKKTIITMAVFFLLFVISAKPASADVAESIGTVVSWILSYVNYALGYILTFLLSILVQVAKYNDFIASAPVKAGWVIVRDLCNMFFILILLVIAFATILRIESYPWKKLLPKLLLMAVLINFSKTIAGLIIDFSQVIMLTFVSAFSQNGANNFVQMFQIDKYLATDKNCDVGKNLGYAILLGSISGTIALIVTLVVTIVLLAVLVMRIVMLWIYIILSPLAYLLSAFPQGQKYSGQWWSEFSKNVITGPILAFFLWLALTTASTTTLNMSAVNNAAYNQATQAADAKKEVCGGTALFTTGPFQKYVVIIGLLIGGLIVTQQAGGAAGSLAGKGIGWAKKFSGAAVAGTAAAAIWKKSSQATKDAVVATGKTAARTTLRAGGAIIGAGAASDSTRGKIGTFVNTWGNDMKTARTKEKAKNRQKTLEKLGMGEKSMEALEVVAKDKKVKRVTAAVKGAVLGAGIAATGGLGYLPALAVGAKAGGALGAGAGTGLQGLRETFGGWLEKWGQKKIDDRNTKVKPHEDNRDTRLSNAERQFENDRRSADQTKAERIGQLRRDEPAGQALAAAEQEMSAFKNNTGGRRDDFVNDLRGRNWAEEDINKAVEAREKELNDNVSNRGRIFNETPEVKTINDDHRVAVERHKQDYESRKKEAQDLFVSDLKANKIDPGISKGIQEGLRDYGKNLKNYNPNHITVEAAKQGAEQLRAADDRRRKLSTDSGNIEDFDASHLYSTSGVTPGQQKFYDKLSDGTKEAADAINNMAKSLAKFSGGMQKPSNDQQKTLVSLKQLIAAQIAAGKSTDHLSGVIGHLDKIDTGDKKGRTKVEEFVEKKSA